MTTRTKTMGLRLAGPAAAAIVLALAACGANEQTPAVDGSVILRATKEPRAEGTALQRVSASKAGSVVQLGAVPRVPTVNEWFDWAETTWPSLFPGKPSTLPFQVYQFRYYAATDLILAATGDTVIGLVGVSSAAPRLISLGVLGDFACAVFPASCTETPATLDTTSASTAAAEVSAFLTVCTTSLPQALRATRGVAAPSVLARALEMRKLARTLVRARAGSLANGVETPPADQFGSCGGRYSHPTYAHASGVTTASSRFEDYCEVDSDTGNRQVLNGTISYVKTGTPSANGPITTRLVSNSPGGLSIVTRTAAGSNLSAQTISFTNYVFTPGVPGGNPTVASPDRLLIDEFVLADNANGKSYRQTGYSASTYETPAGASQMTVSGRGYRSNGTYYDIQTAAPIATDTNGDFTAGRLTFSAGGSITEATLVPGSKLQATMTVNGAPVTAVPACSP